MSITSDLVTAARTLNKAVDALSFSPPTTHVYNPLSYAWEPHRQYLETYGGAPKKVVLLGMNPGPWGMAQTGVPFGEIPAVRDWMGIEAPVEKPSNEHPKRPIEGFACAKSEVSGRRLWGLFAERFGPAEAFFKDHFVLNYCPLVFMEESARNRTPDKIPASEMEAVNTACDRHLAECLRILQPEWALGVGGFAEGCILRVLKAEGLTDSIKTGRILHPSPASPAANRGWAEQATRQMEALGVW